MGINRTFLWVLLLGLTIVALALLFTHILTYVIISLVLAAMLKPLSHFLGHLTVLRFPIPRLLAILISFSMLLGGLGALIYLFWPLLGQQLRVLAALRTTQVLDALQQPIADLEKLVISFRIFRVRPGFMMDALQASTNELNMVNARTLLNDLVGYASNVLIGALAVAFITFFLLYDRGILKRMFLRLVPNSYFELIVTTLFKVERLLGNYLAGLTLQVFSIFTLFSVGLTIIGHPFAITAGVFAAIANLIPYLGPLLGGGFAVLVGLTSLSEMASYNDYVSFSISTIIVSSAVQLVDNLVLQPLIFSKSVKAHPLEIFVVIFAGAALGGILGMVLAIPVYTIIRVSVLEVGNNYGKYRALKIIKQRAEI